MQCLPDIAADFKSLKALPRNKQALGLRYMCIDTCLEGCRCATSHLAYRRLGHGFWGWTELPLRVCESAESYDARYDWRL